MLSLLQSCKHLDSIVFDGIEDSNKLGIVNINIREYQLEGIYWLQKCEMQRHGGLLCDEMGLGKTCQIIGFVSSILKRNLGAKVLIVSPLSVLNFWKAELRRIAPHVTFLLYHGEKQFREILRSSFSNAINVLLTTYELCLSDDVFLQSIPWSLLIVDEGHRLKNSETQIYEMLAQCCDCPRYILTGTPVQNNLTELFNLLHFVAPQYFPFNVRVKFTEYFSDCDTHRKSDELSQILRPFLLRRVKTNVLPELPSRMDVVIYHSLSNTQVRLYRALLTRNADVLSAEISSSSHSQRPLNHINNLFVQLRKCVNHPYLFNGVEPEPFVLGEHLVNTSGKLLLLDALLKHLFNPLDSSTDLIPVHKVLIFSQMTRMLDIIQDYLTLRDYAYERLDGTVRGDRRYQAIEDFNADRQTFVFLLSTRAGGQGLNLTAADTVILVDSDWNPQNDIQAIARAHRIGQTRPVRVIRLVGRYTVDEAVLSRAQAKLKLTCHVLDTTLVADNSSTVSPTFDELSNALKFGLSHLLNSYNDVESLTTGEAVEHTQINMNFSEILGETDPQTGYWLPIPAELINDGANGTHSWVSLTDEPYRCDISEADLKAVEELRKSHEVGKRSLYVPPTAGYSTRLRAPTIAYDPMTLFSDHPTFTQEEIDERNKGIAEAKIKRKQKQVEKRISTQKSLRDSMAYISLSVFLMESILPQTPVSAPNSDVSIPVNESMHDMVELQQSSDESVYQQPGLYYEVADASEPLTLFSKEGSRFRRCRPPYFVCQTVVTEGKWARGGFFKAINDRTPLPKLQYEFAGEADDLQLGDLHIVPIPNPEMDIKITNNLKTFADYATHINSLDGNEAVKWCANFCGLLVAQQYTTRSQLAGAAPDLKLDALERSLSALGLACSTLKACSVHLPILGHGTRSFTWYSVERLLRKCLVDRHGIPVYVYYYRPSGSQNPVSANSTIAQPSSSSNKRQLSADSDNDEVVASKQGKHSDNIFAGKVFYLHNIDQAERMNLDQMIIGYDGDVASQLDSTVTHTVIQNSSNDKPSTMLADQNYHIITVDWIKESVEKNECQPECNYTVA